MIALEQVNSLKEYFQSAESIAIILGPKPTVDQLAVASSLFHGCVSVGKEVGFYAPQKISDDYFLALKELQTNLGKQNLVISFDYDEQAVDKVSYHIAEESKKFYLTIKPKKGIKPLDPKSVEFGYAGTDIDLVFLVGVHDLESLEQLYFGYESLYQNSYVVTLHNFKPEIGTTQFDLSGSSSMSENIIDLFDNLELVINEPMATALLMGIEHTTNYLQSFTTTAETFEKVARLLRMGARRTKRVDSPEISLVVKKKRGRKKKITIEPEIVTEK
ncbi:MAG: hypothetical protein IT416_02520 [Candidatus Pacebacteria bacterium]|nr:hypothetical protein [Candidatus Paceibacterota bacterium]